MGTISVRFVESNGREVTISDAQIGHSLLETAKAHAIEGVLGDCGGGCACATCHVYIDEAWRTQVGEANETEAEMLDLVADIVRPGSRLACQIVLAEALDGLVAVVAPGS